jgi:hypothetical protein
MKPQCLMLLLLTFTFSAARAESILTLDQGQAYQMTYNGKHWVSRVLVTQESAFKGKAVRVNIKGVANGTRSDPALSALFAAPSLNLQSGELVSFDIATNDDVEVPHGTYAVSLDLSSGKARQATQLQLAVPPAVVSPSKLVVTHVLPFMGMGARDVLPKLVVQESGGQSPALIRVNDFPQFSNANGETGGSIVTKAGSYVVAKGALATLDYELQGEFPLGSTTATLTLRSEQLDAPATLAMEVRTRRTTLLLICFVALGLVLGFLLRTVLKQQIQFGEARQQAVDEIRKLQSEQRAANDAQFVDALDKVIVKLRAAITSSRRAGADMFSNAVKTAEDELKAAAEDLRKRTDEVNTQVGQVVAVVGPAWKVDEPAKTALEISRAKLVTARETFKRGEVEEARNDLKNLVSNLGAALTETTRFYRRVYDAFLGNLDEVENLLLAGAKDGFDAAKKQLAEAREAIPAQVAQDDVTKIKDALGAIALADSKANSLLAGLSNSVAHTFAIMDEYLAATALPKPNEWVRANESTRAFARSLPDILNDLNDGPETMRKNAVALHQEWRSALSIQASAAEVSALFDHGSYEEAAKLVAKTLSTPPPAPVRRGGETVQTETQRSLTGESVDASLVASAGLPHFSLRDAQLQEQVFAMGNESVYSMRTLDTVRAIEVYGFWSLLFAKALQWVICAVLLTLVGYLLFADKFVGTTQEMLTAFFWGFTTDIGVDSVINLAKSKTGA